MVHFMQSHNTIIISNWISLKNLAGINRVASGLGISGNLEKSGNFVALEKWQGKVREFLEIRKSQGILIQNWEKPGNFTYAKRISPKFFQNSFK